MAGTEFYDTLETRDPEQRRSEQLAALVAQIDNAKRNSPALTANSRIIVKRTPKSWVFQAPPRGSPVLGPP